MPDTMESTMESPPETEEARLPQMDQATLLVALRDHAVWLETKGREGRRANLRDHDLTACSLAGADLTSANLRGARLAGMDISQAVLREADLTEADLSRVRGQNGQLHRANLSHATLEDAALEDADLTNATLHGARFAHAAMARASLREAVAREARFEAADLTGSDLLLANLRGADFTDAILERANCDGADCREAVFRRTRLSGISLVETAMRGVTLDDAFLIGIDFSKTVDMDVAFQTMAIEQQRRQIDAELEALAEERRKLRKMEAMREMFASLTEREEELSARLREQASSARYFAVLWFIVISLFGAAAAALAAQMPYQRLHVAEISLFYGALAGVLVLCLCTAILPLRFLHMLEAYAALRKRKLSMSYTEIIAPEKAAPTDEKSAANRLETKSLPEREAYARQQA